MSNSNHESDADDFIATLLFDAMIDREDSMFDGPEDRYVEYRAIECYLSLHFPEANKRLRRQYWEAADVPF